MCVYQTIFATRKQKMNSVYNVNEQSQLEKQYGKGLATLFLLRKEEKKNTNFAHIYSDLITWVTNENFFINYCMQKYIVSFELSQQIRIDLLTNLKPTKIKED